ncbi:MAG: PIN/TRAM domain-containing protein [Hydrococcus sp. C42_A2020_068]|uniref:PIN/TRAM domain-containing protein n=1 Tax=Pleurocapsa sp. PCC 7327 TaxID=118163 RepID=UPI00029FE0F8|nr:PIN/TRAM domain-containing protein [Pleurocapsa sp. PCC 7327]AFY79346.1 integral membrane protein (PIN domain superfamily) [Pleurocapsa sp. PCC 7327]MBF2020669.1 PIN/TRAM domain-containing protein [Hydrococcus sp. C42_A2020_068]
MLDAIIIILFILAAAGVGFDSVDLLPRAIQEQISNIEALRWLTAGFTSIIGLALGLVAQTTYRRIEAQIRKTSIETILTRAVGLVVGLLIANLMLAPIFLLPIPEEFAFIKPMMAILGSVIFSFLGISLADTHGRTFLRLIDPNSIETMLVAEGTLQPATSKIIDTSCIIDGRIEQLLATGFIEGQILVPQFVLQELQQLADASNDQKRVRGRRGLDILNRIQEAFPEQIIIHPADYEDLTAVDAKLIRLAQEINATLLTNDYNLSKVANLQKVAILNVNDLAQAIRPIYLPGDTIELKILKPGKEPTQGVGYLEDGTMVVVEEGKDYVGGEVRVIVTSALQTSAGRMIFAKPQSVVASSEV